MGLLLLSGRRRPRYLLRDLFTTPQAAPLASPRTCEPGPGTLTVVDPANHLSVGGGSLTCDGGTGSFGGVAVVGGTLYARAAGRALVVTTQLADTVGRVMYGFSPDVTPQYPTQGSVFFGGTGGVLSIYSGSWGPQVGTYVAGTPYRIAIIARAAGAFFLISGGSYSQWTMIWLDNVSVVNLSPEVWNESAVFSASNLRVLDLPSFSSDDKVYTSRLVSPGIGATATMTPNAWVEINATVPPSGSKYLNVKVRVVDAANYVNIGLDNVGTTIGVSEYVGGVPTWLGGFTVTPSGPSRFVVVLTNAEVKLYLNDAYLGAITSPNFVSAGGLVVGDCAFVVDSIISWPRYPAFPSGV